MQEQHIDDMKESTAGVTEEQEVVQGEVVEGEVMSQEGSASDASSAPAPQQSDGSGEMEERIKKLEAQSAEYHNQWLRAIADYKNYKRRAEAERDELKRGASAGLIIKMLPIIDDFERAMGSVPAEVAETSWWQGTQMIAQKFTMVLESEGVAPIEAAGQMFDPNVHHAVVYEETDDEDGKVTEVLQKGYMQGDRVLRPAMVKVSKNTTNDG